jgi:hypothetical protein
MNSVNLSDLVFTINNAVAGDEVKSVIRSLIQNFSELKGLRSDVELSYKFGTDDFVKSLGLPKNDESSIVLKYCCTNQPIYLVGPNDKTDKKDKTIGSYSTNSPACKVGQGDVKFFLRQRNGKHNFTDVPIYVTKVIPTGSTAPVLAYIDPDVAEKISNNAQLAMARGNYAARVSLVSDAKLPDVGREDQTTAAIQTAVRDGVLSKSDKTISKIPSQTSVDLANVYATITGKPISIVTGNNPIPIGSVATWTDAVVGPDGVKLIADQIKHLAGGCGDKSYFDPYLSAMPVHTQVMVVPGPDRAYPNFQSLYGGLSGGADGMTVTQIVPNLNAVVPSATGSLIPLPTNTEQITQWIKTLPTEFKNWAADAQRTIMGEGSSLGTTTSLQETVVKTPQGVVTETKKISETPGLQISSEKRGTTYTSMPQTSTEIKKVSASSLSSTKPSTYVPSQFVAKPSQPTMSVPVSQQQKIVSLPDFTSSIRFDTYTKP